MSGKLTKILITSANTLLLALLVFTAYGGMIPPDFWVGGAIAAMIFPLFLIIVIIASIIYLFFYPVLTIINFLVMILCLGPILSYCPLNITHLYSKVPEGEASFTLMTYNVTNLSDYTAIERNLLRTNKGDSENLEDPNNGATLRYILSCAPDIVTMQECFGYTLESIMDKYPGLGDSVKTQYPYIYSTPYKPITLLSRYPFEPIDIESRLPEMSYYEVQAYKINIEGHLTYVIGVHLQSIGLSPDDKKLYLDITSGDAHLKHELNEVRHDLISKLAHAYKMRALQADSIRNVLNSLPGNVIVCGDFNDIPDSYAVRTICGDDLRSAYREAGFGPGISFHADRFYFRIDHCLYRGDMTPVKSYFPHNPTSDHYPLITTFVWDKGDKSQ